MESSDATQKCIHGWPLGMSCSECLRQPAQLFVQEYVPVNMPRPRLGEVAVATVRWDGSYQVSIETEKQ